MRTFRLSLLQTLAITFVTAFVACTPGDLLEAILEEDPKTENPDNNSPTTDKNTVTVTANGALVTHGDVGLNLPEGTFTKDVKITIDDIPGGKVYGDLEVSKFFKVTMPVTTAKNTSIRIKNPDLGSDVFLIRSAES